MPLQSCTVRPPITYSLSDIGKEEHMRTFKGRNTKFYAIGQLRRNDFAFVRRSNGQWQYSMVVETYAVDSEERYIKFLIDTSGLTKTVPSYKWSEFIRLLSNTRAIERPAMRRVTWTDSLEESRPLDGDEKSICKSSAAPRSSSLPTANEINIKKPKRRVTVNGERPIMRRASTEDNPLRSPLASRCSSPSTATDEGSMKEPKRQVSTNGERHIMRKVSWLEDAPVSRPTEDDVTSKKLKRRVSVDCCYERSFLTALASIDRKRSVACKSA